MNEAILLQIPHVTEITVNPFQMKGVIEYSYFDFDGFVRKSMSDQEDEATIKTKSMVQISGRNVELANIGKWAMIIWGMNQLTEFEKRSIQLLIDPEILGKKAFTSDSEIILAMILSEIKKFEANDDFGAHVVRNAVKNVLNKINMPGNITQASFVLNNGGITFAYSGLEPAYFGILNLTQKVKIVQPSSSTRIYSKDNPLRGIVVSSFDTVGGKKITKMTPGKILMAEKNFSLQIEDF